MNKEEWLNKYGDEEYCIKLLEKIKWPNGVICPGCSGNQLYYQKTRRVFQCKNCKHQTSATAGTIFHSTKLPLSKWFLAIYLFASDSRGLSSLKLSQALKVNWRSARLISNKIRTVMGSNEKKRTLSGMIECTIMQESKSGNIGGHKNKENYEISKSIIVAVENKRNKPGAVAIHKLDLCTCLDSDIYEFLKTRVNITESRIANYTILGYVLSQPTDALSKLKDALSKLKVNLIDPNFQWEPTINIIRDRINRMIQKIYRGVSPKYLQEYMNELCYKFNNSCEEIKISQKLLEECLAYVYVGVQQKLVMSDG